VNASRNHLQVLALIHIALGLPNAERIELLVCGEMQAAPPLSCGDFYVASKH
jgi:hypothetical protein